MVALNILRYILVTMSAFGAAGLLGSPSESVTVQDLQASLEELGRKGGGTHRISDPRIMLSGGIVVPEGVTLDLGGSEMIVQLSGAQIAGVRLLSNSAIRNGAIVVRSSGKPGMQLGIHAPILVGALYGENASPSRKSRFSNPTGWEITDVILRSDKRVAGDDGIVFGAAGIQIMGGANRGLIERVTIPDSETLTAGIGMDWGTVGPVNSWNIAASAAAYRQGRGYTTHPHDIKVQHVKIGRLTGQPMNGAGTFGIRLSGVHHVTMRDLEIEETTEAAFLHTAGDLGYEFARKLDRRKAHLGITLINMRGGAAGNYLIRTDSYADNIARAAQLGYRPMLDPRAWAGITVQNVVGAARLPGSGSGLRLDHQRGGSYSDIKAHGFARAFYIDELVSDVLLVRPISVNSTRDAVFVGHDDQPPERITIIAPQVRDRSDKAGGITIKRSNWVRVTGADQNQLQISSAASSVSTE